MTLGATTKNTFCSLNKMLFREDEYSSHLSAAGLVPSILTGQGRIVFSFKRSSQAADLQLQALQFQND